MSMDNSLEAIKEYFDRTVADVDRDIQILIGKKAGLELAVGRIDNAIFASRTEGSGKARLNN